MRALRLLLLLLSGCGGSMQLTGNWAASVSGSNGCTGAMTLRQNGSSLGGTWGCGVGSGTLSGSVAGDSVSITVLATGFQPALITATAADDSHMAGFINGSAFFGNAFSATRQ